MEQKRSTSPFRSAVCAFCFNTPKSFTLYEKTLLRYHGDDLIFFAKHLEMLPHPQILAFGAVLTNSAFLGVSEGQH